MIAFIRELNANGNGNIRSAIKETIAFLLFATALIAVVVFIYFIFYEV